MKFCWSTLKVKNMDESLKFYEEIIGLTVNKRFKAGPGMEIVFLGDGETKVELICDENDKDVNIGKDISLGFEVKSVGEMIVSGTWSMFVFSICSTIGAIFTELKLPDPDLK